MKQTKNYPNIAQSFGISGIIILLTILISPMIFLEDLIGTDLLMLIYYILVMGISFWIIYKIRKNKTGNKKFSLTIENKKIIPIIIISTIAILFGITSPISQLIPMPDSIKKMFLDMGSMTGIFSFILAVIAAPIFEELIFRGVILDGLLKKYSPIISILISSFLFGFVHLNPWQFVGAFIIGIFSGWIYYKTKSLFLSIIIHAVTNLSALLVNSLINNDLPMDETLLESYGGLLNLLLLIIGSIVILIYCIYLLRKEFIKENINTGNKQQAVIINAE